MKELMLIEILQLNDNDENVTRGKYYKVYSTEYIDEFIDEDGETQECEDFIITIKDDIGQLQEIILSDCKIIETYNEEWKDYFEDVYWVECEN